MKKNLFVLSYVLSYHFHEVEIGIICWIDEHGTWEKSGMRRILIVHVNNSRQVGG